VKLPSGSKDLTASQGSERMTLLRNNVKEHINAKAIPVRNYGGL
jgi:hypothetical protein